MTKIKYIPMGELWYHLELIADDAEKTGMDWTTIGGVGVFGHLVKAYGFEDAKRIFKEYDRKTDDIDIITKQYGMIDLMKNLFGEEIHKSLSLLDKYTIKNKESGIHIDIYIPRKVEDYLKFNENEVREDIFGNSVEVQSDGTSIKIAPIKDLMDLKLNVYTGRNRGKKEIPPISYFKRMNRKERKGKIKHKKVLPRKKDMVDITLLAMAAEKEGVDLKELYKYTPWKLENIDSITQRYGVRVR